MASLLPSQLSSYPYLDFLDLNDPENFHASGKGIYFDEMLGIGSLWEEAGTISYNEVVDCILRLCYDFSIDFTLIFLEIELY